MYLKGIQIKICINDILIFNYIFLIFKNEIIDFGFNENKNINNLDNVLH